MNLQEFSEKTALLVSEAKANGIALVDIREVLSHILREASK